MQSRRVLVIDDNPDVRSALASAVRLGDHDVEVAANGPAGLRLMEERRPDVVLCDLTMPGMDGFEVARRIRADAQWRNVMLVALSGHSHEVDRARSRAAGFDHHLGKPPEIDDLLDLIKQASPRAADGAQAS